MRTPRGTEHIVCWVDSKATFGDHRTHVKQVEEQYCTYVNRCGSVRQPQRARDTCLVRVPVIHHFPYDHPWAKGVAVLWTVHCTALLDEGVWNPCPAAAACVHLRRGTRAPNGLKCPFLCLDVRMRVTGVYKGRCMYRNMCTRPREVVA